jgi:hypothetical protein
LATVTGCRKYKGTNFTIKLFYEIFFWTILVYRTRIEMCHFFGQVHRESQKEITDASDIIVYDDLKGLSARRKICLRDNLSATNPTGIIFALIPGNLHQKSMSNCLNNGILSNAEALFTFLLISFIMYF